MTKQQVGKRRCRNTPLAQSRAVKGKVLNIAANIFRKEGRRN